MHVSAIREKLSSYPIQALSSAHRFNLRSDAKVCLLSFLGSFFLSLCQDHSLRNWASHLSNFLADGVKVSKAGLQKRLGSRQLASVKAFLETVMNRRIEPLLRSSQSQGILARFDRVFVEDSVCVKLNSALFSLFPGSHSKKGEASTARIQVCLDLKRLNYERFEVMSYRENDQRFSGEIINLIQAGDLIIRDLGYWSLAVFARLSRIGAFFLTRYRPTTNLYDEQGKQIDLLDLLAKRERRGGNFCDQWVWVGQKERVRMRLLALKCPPEVAEQRIRKAKKNRHANANHNEAYYELLKWNLLLTNVESDTWNVAEAMEVYGFRWHIEMIFKVWKGAFDLQRLMTQAQIKKSIHAQLFFYLFLCYLTLFYIPYYRFFLEKIYLAHQRILSPFGFARFLKRHLCELIQLEQDQLREFYPWIEALCREALYEKRKKRANQLELIFQIRKPNRFVMKYPHQNP